MSKSDVSGSGWAAASPPPMSAHAFQTTWIAGAELGAATRSGGAAEPLGAAVGVEALGAAVGGNLVAAVGVEV